MTHKPTDLVRVQGEYDENGRREKDVPQGYIEWWEHTQAWEDYTKMYAGQDAQTIADRGGFGWNELVDHLGGAPTTWRPREPERFKDYKPPVGKAGRL